MGARTKNQHISACKVAPKLVSVGLPGVDHQWEVLESQRDGIIFIKWPGLFLLPFFTFSYINMRIKAEINCLQSAAKMNVSGLIPSHHSSETSCLFYTRFLHKVPYSKIWEEQMEHNLASCPSPLYWDNTAFWQSVDYYHWAIFYKPYFIILITNIGVYLWERRQSCLYIGE